MRTAFTLIALLVFLAGCSMRMPKKAEPSFNERMLEMQRAKIENGEDVYGDRMPDPSTDPVQSSLWAKSVGSPYIIRNQKASKVGDLITILVEESSSASTAAKTETERDSSMELGYGFLSSMNNPTLKDRIKGSGTSDFKNEFTGEGTTDRSGSLKATVQAVVETVLPNGTLFVRGRKLITINNEDQIVELTGFVRPDDIRINNTVNSSLIADAKIRYLGEGVIGDKQYVGWGTRLMDWIWPF